MPGVRPVGGAPSNISRGQGSGQVRVSQGKIVKVNSGAWTVDAITQFDQRAFPSMQVLSPYLHYNSGEGFFALPEMGAQCMICEPSDSTRPFVLGFCAPMERSGTTGKMADGAAVQEAVFHAGRQAAQPGDMGIRGRDGNFMILRRGGVLEIGATELAQRIFIPIGNVITDVSGEYNHYNTGGGIKWGMMEGPDAETPTCLSQTYRVFANDKFADVRVSYGNVKDVVSEPAGSPAHTALANAGYGGSTSSPIPTVMEVAIAPGGFDAHGCLQSGGSTKESMVFHLMLDRAGNLFGRVEGNAVFYFKKNLSIEVTENLSLKAQGVSLDCNSLELSAPAYAAIKAPIVKLGAGSIPVAMVGSLVTVPMPIANVSGSMLIGGVPTPFTGVATFTTALTGAVMNGRSGVLV